MIRQRVDWGGNMSGLEHSGSKIRKLLPAWLSQAQSDVAAKAAADAAVVRLMDLPRRVPATPMERRLSAVLKAVGPVSVAGLVKRVAAELYRDELRKGAGVLDIGLLGDRLFNRDILQELKAGDGILWEIKQEPEIG
jgi:hypothetical protein